MSKSPLPDAVPVLSRGRHRNPSKGACFMEYASFLAGERWSDHPKCTHPLLAATAREVNDHVADRYRGRLVPLVPDVVGLDTDDPTAAPRIARECALFALPVVPAGRQRVLAVGLLNADRALAALTGGEGLSREAEAALDGVPDAWAWARKFESMDRGYRPQFSPDAAAAIVHNAVAGLAEAATEDPDALLVSLLEHLVGRCKEWFGAPAAAPVAAPPPVTARRRGVPLLR